MHRDTQERLETEIYELREAKQNLASEAYNERAKLEIQLKDLQQKIESTKREKSVSPEKSILVREGDENRRLKCRSTQKPNRDIYASLTTP